MRAGTFLMSFRLNGEIEASFRRVEQMLDTMLEESRAYIEREGIGLRDESNRSGFDPGGFPYFVWAYYFEKREAYGSEIKRAEARLSYREPVYKDESRMIEVTSGAEIFQIGKQSRKGNNEGGLLGRAVPRRRGAETGRDGLYRAAEQVLAKY
jgi:hypothetical protein